LHKVKGSKHFSYAIPVQSEAEIKQHLEALRSEHYASRHVCYSYRLGADHAVYRFNDAGEPSGSAGKPIYGQIQSFEITDCLVVVVRYFGGTKLGVGGLIDAYRTAARMAIEEADTVVREIYATMRIDFTYDQMGIVMNLLKDFNLSPKTTDFQVTCTLDVEIPLAKLEAFEDRIGDIYDLKWETLTK
jgi:uncharacterized YigZ family protein